MPDDLENIAAYPLSWDNRHPRTKPYDRTFGRFNKKDQRGHGNKALSVADGAARVLTAIKGYSKAGHPWRADPEQVIISTNLRTRKDGLPMSGQKEPEDPGVAVYFTLDGKHRCIPLDSYMRIADNLAGVAATLEALRTIERHGSTMFEAAYTGFTGLPSPEQVNSASTWRDVLGYWGNNLDECKKCYRKAASNSHPDKKAGNQERFKAVQLAWGQAQQSLKSI